MLILPVTSTHHLTLDYFCQKETKPLLLAYLVNEERSGCYIYFDAQYQPLYVGKSGALHSRLKSHATAKGVECKMPEWYFIGVVITENPHYKEAELVRMFSPKYNQLLKRD